MPGCHILLVTSWDSHTGTGGRHKDFNSFNLIAPHVDCFGVFVGLSCTMLFFFEICEPCLREHYYALVGDRLGESMVFGRSRIVLDFERPARNLAALRGTTMLSSPLVASILNKLSPRLGSEFGC